MSNVMDLKRLQNHVSRNAFDLSERKCFTAKVGELLPVYLQEVLPGDKFDLKVQSFTRTQPVNTAAFTRIKEYYDYFFVPYRLLWRYFDTLITQTNSNPQFANGLNEKALIGSQHPFLSPSGIAGYFNRLKTCAQAGNANAFNYFGYYRGDLSIKLLRYLGLGCLGGTMSTYGTDTNGNYTISSYGTIGTGSPVPLNAFPLLAYQKICQDYFRNSQWESSNPTLYNVDYLNNVLKTPEVPLSQLIAKTGASVEIPRNLFDLNYCNWNKDLFMGVLPEAQYGGSTDIGTITIPTEVSFSDLNLYNGQLDGKYSPDNSSSAFSAENIEGYYASGAVRLSAERTSTFNVIALRQAEALQKWKEITMSGQLDYKDQIKKHFGVDVPNSRSNLCEWIGGTSDNLDITEVINTSLDAEGSQADIAGKGVGSLGGYQTFEAKEHGIVMCIYHAIPLLDYMDSVTKPIWFKTKTYDYAIPEFDRIGMQTLPGLALSSAFMSVGQAPDTSGTVSSTSDGMIALGYVPRYIDYKTSIDTVTGAFSDTLKYWTAAVGDSYFKQYLKNFSSSKTLDYSFFKVNPSVLDTIFAVNANGSWNTDNLLINSFHDVKVVRNLDYDGLPY